MSCSGLHCAGCAGGAAVPVVPLAAAFGLAWIAEHLIEVLAVCAVCGLLAVAAVVVLMRWCERRDARHVPLWVTRVPPAAVTAAEARPAIGPAVVNFNFYGTPAAEQAAVIRTVIPGTAGDAITEGGHP